MVEKRPGLASMMDVLLLSVGMVCPAAVFGTLDGAAIMRDALSSFSWDGQDDMEIKKVTRL